MTANGGKEDHILSCFKMNEMCCYYLIESAAQHVVMFRFCNWCIWWIYSPKREDQISWMNKGPYQCVIMDDVNGKVSNLVIVPRIFLKHPCKEYSKMGFSESKKHFSNIPQVEKDKGLNWNQPLAVSFVYANNSFVIDNLMK